ncbi:hypothetical protein MKW98_026062 [Papaver atlanticum]|uniref:Uncharacterized protein n=1 Tax=Papaver atlanticum TaxID=357466 RepID=A0AAD4RY13_9MAGN|nr:hypothetical protein MKW98_026062 [Papaver atlanticum]
MGERFSLWNSSRDWGYLLVDFFGGAVKSHQNLCDFRRFQFKSNVDDAATNFAGVFSKPDGVISKVQ